LFVALPDAGAFDARVEQLFIENNDLTTQAEIKLLEILAQSGTAFSDTLSSYRVVIFVLLLFATALLVAALVFLVMLVTLNRRMAQIERVGIQVNSLLISREENTVYLNNLGFKLTDAAMETRPCRCWQRRGWTTMCCRGPRSKASFPGALPLIVTRQRVQRASSAYAIRWAIRSCPNCWSRTSRGVAICWP
jgi:hypothetical protein